jgi:hypothetical protein
MTVVIFNKAVSTAAVAVVLLGWTVAGGAIAVNAAESAADLMARVIARQQTTGFSMRATLTIRPAGGKAPQTIQIRAIGQQSGNRTRMLYQALSPDDMKGRAAIVDRVVGQPIQGSLFTPPDSLTPIAAAQLTDPVLGSDMTFEDLAEAYQSWPTHTMIGSDTVEGNDCRVVESRPAPGTTSTYPLIRSCLSESKLLAVRVEQIGANGKVVKRFTLTRTARSPSGVVTARTLDVQNLERGSSSTIDITRGERDIIVASADFSLAKIKSLGR